MSSFVKFASPFIKGFVHADVLVTASVGSNATTILAKAQPHERRASVIIQNKDTADTVFLIFDANASAGILVPPLGSIALDNYNGIVRAYSSASPTNVHVAYATA